MGGWEFGSKVPLVIFLTFPFLFNPVYASASLVKKRKKIVSRKFRLGWLLMLSLLLLERRSGSSDDLVIAIID